MLLGPGQHLLIKNQKSLCNLGPFWENSCRCWSPPFFGGGLSVFGLAVRTEMPLAQTGINRNESNHYSKGCFIIPLLRGVLVFCVVFN